MNARICVVTSGHLSTSPRMLKAADALAAAGYRVRVVSTNHVSWARVTDEEVRRLRSASWEWAVVAYDRRHAAASYLRSGVRQKLARWLAKLLASRRCPHAVAARAFSRVHSELVRAALAWPADLYYGGTTGALAAIAEVGRRAGRPYAIDLEDFYSAAQGSDPSSRLTESLAEQLERRVLKGAAFLTAGSAEIARAYTKVYGVHVLPVNNTFPLPEAPPNLTPSPGAALRVYWFSQTIGPGRGLEDAVRAMGLADRAGELHLRGREIPEYMRRLRDLATQAAPRLQVVVHSPAPPDAMVDLCRGYDVGLGVEQGETLNGSLCLSNKICTYLLAGLAVVLTDTPGVRPVALDLGADSILYRAGDLQALAAGLQRWADDKSRLAKAKAAAWGAAVRRWHWEHPEERGILLDAVAQVLA